MMLLPVLARVKVSGAEIGTIRFDYQFSCQPHIGHNLIVKANGIQYWAHIDRIVHYEGVEGVEVNAFFEFDSASIATKFIEFFQKEDTNSVPDRLERLCNLVAASFGKNSLEEIALIESTDINKIGSVCRAILMCELGVDASDYTQFNRILIKLHQYRIDKHKHKENVSLLDCIKEWDRLVQEDYPSLEWIADSARCKKIQFEIWRRNLNKEKTND